MSSWDHHSSDTSTTSGERSKTGPCSSQWIRGSDAWIRSRVSRDWARAIGTGPQEDDHRCDPHQASFVTHLVSWPRARDANPDGNFCFKRAFSSGSLTPKVTWVTCWIENLASPHAEVDFTHQIEVEFFSLLSTQKPNDFKCLLFLAGVSPTWADRASISFLANSWWICPRARPDVRLKIEVKPLPGNLGCWSPALRWLPDPSCSMIAVLSRFFTKNTNGLLILRKSI